MVLAANEVYVPYLSVMFESILANSKDENRYDMMVLTRNISPNSREMLASQFTGRDNFSLRFVDVTKQKSDFTELFTRSHYQIETYYRLLVQEILCNYPKALYLDSDMVVNRDLADLFSTDVDGYLAAACRDPEAAGRYSGYERGKKRYVDEILSLENPYDYFQAGMILFNLNEMRASFDCREIMEFAFSREWDLLDQDVLNVLFEGHVKFVEMGWNVVFDWKQVRIGIIENGPEWICEEYMEARKKKYIIHYAGPNKPWNEPHMDMSSYFWDYARSSPYYETLVERKDAFAANSRKGAFNRLAWAVAGDDPLRHDELEMTLRDLREKGSWLIRDDMLVDNLDRSDKMPALKTAFADLKTLLTMVCQSFDTK